VSAGNVYKPSNKINMKVEEKTETDKGHSLKALLIYPEFPGCPYNCGFFDITLP
jgi:hypothetical protein